MTRGKIADRIVDFSNPRRGPVAGGLAHVNVLASMLFAGITGVALGDIAALGSIFIPAMKKQGYDSPFLQPSPRLHPSSAPLFLPP